MDISRFINENAATLSGKTVVLTGADGGFGKEICRCLAPHCGKLILINHLPEKADEFWEEMCRDFPEANIRYLRADFENVNEVEALCRKLSDVPIDFLFHNAGAYCMPRRRNAVGVDCVFQINFLSPYYITKKLLPNLRQQGGKVIVMGSIAHSGAKADRGDIDFPLCNIPSRIYGNSKRYLMYAHEELLKNEASVRYAIAHPGISPTGITRNYPKALGALTKIPMKIMFMSPKEAGLSAVRAILEDSPQYSWFGPKFFNIWGSPELKALEGCNLDERKFIFETAEKLYDKMEKSCL